MRFSRIALLVAPSLAGLVSLVAAAQELPVCAATCLQSSLEAQDTCSPTNTTCICTDKPLNAAIQACVLQSCTVINALAAQNVTQTMCGGEVRDITHITPIISGTSGAAAIIAVIVRVWMSGSSFWLDDAMCVIAIVFAIPMAVLEFLMSNLGFGKDIWTLTPDAIYRIVQYTWLTEIFWFVSMGCIKLAFLFLYLRVFPRQKLRKTVYSLIGIGTLSVFIFTIICTVNCLPVTYIWTSWDGQHEGKCINLNSFVWAHAVLDIVFDCVIFALPIPELIKLKMSLKKRIMIVAMFSVGGIGTIVSILRLQSLLAFAKSTNPTYDNCPTAYWSVLSCFVGIFCACMPSMRRLLAKVFPNCFASSNNNSKYNKYDNTPNARISSGKIPSGRKASRSGIGSALNSFGGITKTVDTTVTRIEDDELELVHVRNKDRIAQSNWSTGNGSEKSENGRAAQRIQ